MIIGTGNIANTIINSGLPHENLCIIAAGVSDSNIVNDTEFNREKQMLLHHLKTNSDLKIIYFDTFYKNHDSHYVRHKKNMRKLIEKYANNFLFISLPIVCGITKNKMQLIPYLSNCLLNNETVAVNFNATRNIIPSSAIVDCIRQTLDSNFKYVAVLSTNNYGMTEIIKTLENIHQKKYKIKASNNKRLIYNTPNLEQYEYISWCKHDLNQTLKNSIGYN